MELNICHLYPDILNLYGDRGNILCMQKRLEWRGIGVTVTGVSIGQALEASAYDLLFVGGGQDFEQEVLLGDLAGAKTEELKSAIEDGLPVLAICGGYQLLGKYYKTEQGTITGLDLVDLYTEQGEGRLISNIVLKSDLFNMPIVGFENHGGRTCINNCKPLGKVLYGSGNDGQTGYEGVVYKNVIGTYLHGPLLTRLRKSMAKQWSLHLLMTQKRRLQTNTYTTDL